MIVQHGNKKVGSIPTVNLMPGVTCSPDAPCKGRDKCYFWKFLARPSVKMSLQKNLDIYRMRPAEYFAGIREYLDRYQPPMMRLHSAGDFCDQEHVNAWIAIAKDYPAIRFLAFTKRYGFDYSRRPKNLQIVFSAWPDYPMPARPRGIRVAWLHDPKNPDKRIPKNAVPCAGLCEDCGMCWSLSTLKRDVVFNKH